MTHHSTYDAIIVGAGPNGLAAAITLARAGCSVLLVEAKETIGGGMRTADLTLPGYLHDVCSAIHPLGMASPFFRDLPLAQYGLEWIQPPLPLAHPFDDGSAAILDRSIEATAQSLGPDAEAYCRLMRPLVTDWEKITTDLLGPLPLPPRHPLALIRFGLQAIRSAKGLAERHFKGERAQALFAGLAAHSIMPLEKPATAAFGLMLGILGHAVGWPLPKGGSQRIADALGCYLQSLGGKIITGQAVQSVDDLPPARALLMNLTPRQVLALAGQHLPPAYRRQLARYRYGPGVFKIDWALDGPIPWQAGACRRAGTVHVGGTLPEIAASERQMWQGQPPEKPFVLIAQQSLFDSSRAPTGKHTAWTYCHVPHGSSFDMTERVTAQLERFAPGFQDRVLARSIKPASAFEAYNANYIGGDINGGVQDIGQLFTRPAIRLNPYTTPNRRLFICSSSTPPGGGVHGMCGYHAARAVLKYMTRVHPQGLRSDSR